MKVVLRRTETASTGRLGALNERCRNVRKNGGEGIQAIDEM